MARLDPQPLTFDQFIEWERQQALKHEFVDGQPVAMAGGSEAHTIIQANLIAVTVPKLRGSPCRPFPSDLLVHTGNGHGRYPDMTIDCGPRAPGNMAAPNPVVVFEILSPESQRRDRTEKLADYNFTPTIAHYVLIEQAEPLVHIYDRAAHGEFALRPRKVRGLDGVVDLPAVGVSLGMWEVYEGLEGYALL